MNIPKKSLATNAILNGIKQGCAILFPVIVFPYVSRILGANNYGKISFSTSIMTYITLIAGLGVKNYAIREGARVKNEKKEFDQLVCEIFTINVLSTLLAFLALAFLIIFWRKLDDYRLLIVILCSSVVFTTIGADWINSIFEDYLYIAIRYIICHLVALVAIFLFVRKSEDYIAYAVISILAEVMANILNVYHINRTLKVKLKIVFSKDIFRHLHPIMLIFGTAIATRIYVNSDITILGIFCTDGMVGNYTVAARVYSLVKQLVNALMIVAIPRISNLVVTENSTIVGQKLEKLFTVILIFVLPLAVGLFLLREEIIYLISGSGYEQASAPLGVLAVSLVFASLACFFINVVMLPNKKEDKILLATTISAIVNIVLNFVLIPITGIIAAALTTLISEFIMLVFGIIYSKGFFQYHIKPFICAAIGGGLILVDCLFVKGMFESNLCRVIISILVGVVLFTANIMFFYSRNILNVLRNKSLFKKH